LTEAAGIAAARRRCEDAGGKTLEVRGQMDASRTDSRPHHPAVLEQEAQRAKDLQLRIADAITAYAGSIPFVYVHIAVFAVWMLMLESRPWPTLILVVSLEAIFLSTFVMIG
jgi:uncharacterized membrane protein